MPGDWSRVFICGNRSLIRSKGEGSSHKPCHAVGLVRVATRAPTAECWEASTFIALLWSKIEAHVDKVSRIEAEETEQTEDAGTVIGMSWKKP